MSLGCGCEQACTHLLHYRVLVGGAEGLLQVLVLCGLALRNVHEYVGDLQDVIEVGLDTVPPFLDLILVASYLRKMRRSPQIVRCHAFLRTSNRFPPFFRRTIETLVSLRGRTSVRICTASEETGCALYLTRWLLDGHTGKGDLAVCSLAAQERWSFYRSCSASGPPHASRMKSAPQALE